MIDFNPLKKARRITSARFEMCFWYINIIFWPALSGWINPKDMKIEYIEIIYFISIVLTIIAAYMIIQCKKEIQSIFRFFDDQTFKDRIQKQTEELYKLTQAIKSVQQIIDKTKAVKNKIELDLAPIYPDKNGFVRKWVADEFNPTIINGFWAEDYNRYEIKCPAQLRNHIILMQNSLPDIFEEILNSKGYKEIYEGKNII